MNDAYEALPFWKLFEDATGIKVELIRASDVVLIGRIAIEQRARQRSWDLLLSPAVSRLPRDFLQPADLAEAKNLMAEARDPDRRWYGVYANYDVPSFNSKLVKASDLPKSYEDFLNHKEWAGKIAIEQTDTQWVERAVHLLRRSMRPQADPASELSQTLNPVLIDGRVLCPGARTGGGRCE